MMPPCFQKTPAILLVSFFTSALVPNMPAAQGADLLWQPKDTPAVRSAFGHTTKKFTAYQLDIATFRSALTSDV